MKNLHLLKKIILCSFLFFSIFIKSASAEEIKPVHEPLPSELLKNPIALKCDAIKIDEWRPDSHYPQFTSMTPEGIAALNTYCLLAIKKYPDFLKELGGFIFTVRPIEMNITLAPANKYLDGLLPRNLNDNSGRIKFVSPECCIWGSWFTSTKRLFLRNDPVYFAGGNPNKPFRNKHWERTFLHEMAHIMNDFYGVFRTFPPLSVYDDEKLAEEFVTWLGYTFKTESSSTDLRIKKSVLEDESYRSL